MKKCLNCGYLNEDFNVVCTQCGQNLGEFDTNNQKSPQENLHLPPQQINPQMPPPPMNPIPPIPPQRIIVSPQPIPEIKPQKPINVFDVLSLIAFVASICGIFWSAIILLPLAFFLAVLGCVKGSRFKGLAIAAVIISSVAGIMQFVYILYKNGYIPEWIFWGLFKD